MPLVPTRRDSIAARACAAIGPNHIGLLRTGAGPSSWPTDLGSHRVILQSNVRRYTAILSMGPGQQALGSPCLHPGSALLRDSYSWYAETRFPVAISSSQVNP